MLAHVLNVERFQSDNTVVDQAGVDFPIPEL